MAVSANPFAHHLPKIRTGGFQSPRGSHGGHR
jgi:hypothetical protein